jgi:hypothetical protein
MGSLLSYPKISEAWILDKLAQFGDRLFCAKKWITYLKQRGKYVPRTNIFLCTRNSRRQRKLLKCRLGVECGVTVNKTLTDSSKLRQSDRTKRQIFGLNYHIG